MSKHVFISYVREDAAFAREILRRLRRSDIVAWQDVQDLRGGDGWQQTIDQALTEAKALIVVMSPAATRSQYVTYEWAYALGAGVRVIPVLRSRTELHPRLAALQYVDFTPRAPRKPWVRLLNALPTTGDTRKRDGGLPVIRARFDMTDGKPSKVKGGEYVIWLWVENAPSDVRKVNYEMHDDSFAEPRWSESNVEKQFETWTQSYGDVLVTATLRTGARKHPRIGSTLFEALRQSHATTRNASIRKALRDIETN